jgi:hypothetical protein
METFSGFFGCRGQKLPVAVRRYLGIRPPKWHDAKMDTYIAFRISSFFCFLDGPVQLELIFPKLFRIKVVRLKEKKRACAE